VTYYDDHEYCERCRLHTPSCWCFSSRSASEQVERGEEDAEDICHGGPGHGFTSEGTPPWPVGGPISSAVDADNPPAAIAASAGCRFSDVARVFLVPAEV
jgi:hypothetical protein